MKLFERLSHRPNGRPFHSAIVTTFSVEFAAFEQILLPQFESAGATNIVLIADRRMTALAMADGSAPPREAGRAYVVTAPEPSGGVFHPKVILQVGRQAARAIIASANATSAGIGGNLEIAFEVSCTEEASSEQEFVRAIWRYLDRIVTEEASPANDALVWMARHTPWLSRPSEPEQPVWALEDGTELAFFANADGSGRSIIARYVERLANPPVDRIVVVSPYWDHDLAALRSLIGALRPKHAIVILQERHGLFPGHAARHLGLKIVGPPADAGSRFVHAKLIIATSGDFDHVLMGSANCTTAALGVEGAEGVNGEACVYRRLPSGTLLDALNLTAALNSPPIALDDIPAFEPEASIPLEDLTSRAAGEFEADLGHLSWRPPASAYPAGGDVELLDVDLGVIDFVPTSGWRHQGSRLVASFESSADQARFARFKQAGGWSSLAIIHRKDTLRERRRERSNRTVDRAKAAIDDSLDIDLLHLELLTQLERADAEDERLGTGPRLRRQGAASVDEPARVLPYEEFVRTKREARTRSAFIRNALGDRHVNSIRGLLNRIVGADLTPETRKDIREVPNPFDLGDEVEEDIDADQNLDWSDADSEVPPPAAEIEPQPRASFDAKVFEKAVARYAAEIGARAANGLIGATDVLRLRLMLLLVLTHSSPPGTKRKELKLEFGTREGDWPRLLVRLLAAFFVGKETPITRLAVDPTFDRIPDDFIEAWATAIWSADLCQAVVTLNRPSDPLLKHLPTLSGLVRKWTGLTEAELAGEIFTSNADRLEKRFGPRLRAQSLQNATERRPLRTI